jgi:hypothetical protein
MRWRYWLPRAFRYPSHSFDAVHDQVQKHLLQLNAITRDRPVVHGQIGTQHDVVPAAVLADEAWNKTPTRRSAS